MDIEEAKAILLDKSIFKHTYIKYHYWVGAKTFEAIETVLLELGKKNNMLKDIKMYLEFYLMDNMQYKDSQEIFEKLLRMLNKGC